MGFYNFCFGFILLLITFGYWVKYHQNVKIKNILVLSLLSIALYFSHLLLLAILYVLIVTYGIISVIIDKQGKVVTVNLSYLVDFSKYKNGLKTVIAFSPSIILGVIYLLQLKWGNCIWGAPLELTAYLLSVHSIVFFDSSNIFYLAIGVGILFYSIGDFLPETKNRKAIFNAMGWGPGGCNFIIFYYT